VAIAGEMGFDTERIEDVRAAALLCMTSASWTSAARHLLQDIPA